MRSQSIAAVVACGCWFVLANSVWGQAYAPPDRGQPGDEMIQKYLAGAAVGLDAGFLDKVGSADEWNAMRPRLKQEYLYMLGLWPLPEKTPLHATITGAIEQQDYVVDLLHYQSRPHLYVTANLYRPKQVKPDQRLPAVLYVCGHSGMGRNGSKTAYQAHGIWFARHGYVCLVVDTLQLGEIAAIHHGTYREQRWWWHSRGYTSAGVECWNGVRGIDYLISRADVDPERIAVTGISGGGAATFWIAAADERVKAAVPVSGMADLESYVGNRVINGHCDCMFATNTFQWPWTRIAGLIAPRPLLFSNSDHDAIFPMDANERIINRLERLYSLFGAGDLVDSQVSVGGHAYRKDIRQGAFRFINAHLKNDPRIVADSEELLPVGSGKDIKYPIAPEKLRAFATDGDLPRDQRNTTIDQHFVPLAEVGLPAKDQVDAWRKPLADELRRVSFRYFPARIPAAILLDSKSPGAVHLETEPGIQIQLRIDTQPPATPSRVLLLVTEPQPAEGASDIAERKTPPEWLAKVQRPGDAVVWVDTRGVGATRWTRKNPPNYVERSHALLGRTVDTGRVWDVAAAARFLRAKAEKLPVHVAGHGAAGVLAAYAALWESDIAGVTLVDPPASHMEPTSPAFLNVLRVCDLPDTLGMLAPRPLVIHGGKPDSLSKVTSIYAAAGASRELVIE